MSEINLRILLSAAKGNVTSVIGDVTKALGPGAGGLAGALTAVGVIGVGALVAVGVQAGKMAAEYQSAMTQLQNTTGSSDAQMKGYTATIRELSDSTGKAQTDLAAGMYQIISANFAGADATRILTTATQAAIIAHADQTKVTTGLVVTLNAFGLKADQVDSVSNRMFKTLSLGRGQMGDLAGALQTGGALVAHYGVSVTDMDATLATLSTGGMKTFGTSMTGLTQLLNVMDGKTDLITGRLHKLHINFDEGKFKAMDYEHQIAYLTETFKGHEKQMVAVLGSKQAATALGILGTQAPLLAANVKKLGDAQDLAKQKQDAWTKVQGDFNFQWDKLKTNVQNLLIDLVLKLLPILTPIVKTFSDWAVNLQYTFVPWLRNAVDGFSHIVYWFQQGSGPAQALKILLEGIGVAIGLAKIASVAQDIAGMASQAASFISGPGKNLLAYFTNDLTGAANGAGTAVSNIGADAEANVGKVQAAAVEEETALGETTATADATAASVTGIGTAAEAAAGKFAGFLSLAAKFGGLALLASQYGETTIPQPSVSGADQGKLQKVWQEVYPLSEGNAPNPSKMTSEQLMKVYQQWEKDYPGTVFPWFKNQGLASGGLNIPAGVYTVGERGPERMYVPGGSHVAPHGTSLGGSVIVYLTVNNPMRTSADTERMLDEVEQGLARRFRSQTPSFGFGGIL